MINATKNQSKPGWLCYCHLFAPDTVTEKYKLLLEALMEEHNVDLEKIKCEGKLKLSDSKTDKNSVYYKPETVAKCIEFGSALSQEMILRRKPIRKKTVCQK